MANQLITVSWLVEDRLIFVRMVGDLTLDDFAYFDREVTLKLDVGTTPVHIVADVTTMQNVKGNPMGIHREITHLGHPNLGNIAIAGMNPVVRFLASTVFQILGKRVAFHPTVGSALQAILESDPSLPQTIGIPEYYDE